MLGWAALCQVGLLCIMLGCCGWVRLVLVELFLTKLFCLDWVVVNLNLEVLKLTCVFWWSGMRFLTLVELYVMVVELFVLLIVLFSFVSSCVCWLLSFDWTWTSCLLLVKVVDMMWLIISVGIRRSVWLLCLVSVTCKYGFCSFSPKALVSWGKGSFWL